MKRVVFELDKNLTEGELLIYRDGMIKSVDVHEVLPDLRKAKEDIALLKKNIAEMRQTIADLAKIIKEK